MKKLSIYLVLYLMGILSAFAQKVDRSKAPQPGPAPRIQLGKYESFKLPNGLTVFVVENHKLPRVAFSLALDLDPILEGEAAGYVSLTGELLRRGTKTRTKDQIDQEVDFIGASLAASSTGVYGSSLKKHTDKLLSIMSDVILNPSFPQEEFEKVKKETLSELIAAKDEPDAIASNVESVLTYGKTHPYGEIMTEKTVEKITVDQCKKFYTTYFRPGVAYLAVVGDITPAEARLLVMKYLGAWKPGKVPAHKYGLPKPPAAPQVAVVDKAGAVQTVLSIVYPVEYKLGAPDYLKARVMNEILGGGSFGSRLFQRLREEKGYTYGAGSSITQDKVVGAFSASAKVRTEVTDSAVVEFVNEMNRIRDEKITDEELKRVKSVMTGSFARSLENPQTVANFAINIARYGLPKDYYETYLQKLAAITVEDVQAMAKKYILPQNAHIIAVGNVKAIEEKLKRFGTVTRYDMYGNVETAPDASAMKNVTAQQVIDKYIAAIGGKDKLKTIASMRMKAEAEQQGMKMVMTQSKKAPGKMLIVLNIPFIGDVTQVYDGKKGVTVMGKGNTEEMKGEQLAWARTQAMIFPELAYQEAGYKLELSDVKKVDDRQAYELIMTSPTGNKNLRYFDIQSGLLIKEIDEEGTPTYWGDYKEVNGVKFPHLIKIESQMGKFDFKVTSYEINPQLGDELFSGQ